MELGKPGPHFISLNKDTELLSADSKTLDVTECRIGDRILVEEAKALNPNVALKMDDGLPTWPPKTTAVAVKSRLLDRLRLHQRIAIAIVVGQARRDSRLHYRFYDPFTMSEMSLPRSCNDQKPKHHDLIKVTYAEYDSGTWVDTKRQLRIPANYPGEPENFTRLRQTEYVPLKWMALCERESAMALGTLKHPDADKLQSFVVDDLLLAGAAAKQAIWKARTRLANDTVVPAVKESASNSTTLTAEYVPSSDKGSAMTDLTKAARLLREGQSIMVSPADGQSNFCDSFVLATVGHSIQTASGTIQLEYIIPNAVIKKRWGDIETVVGGKEWKFEPAPQIVITPQFREFLLNRGITALLKEAGNAPPGKIIETLLGRIEAVSPTRCDNPLNVVHGSSRTERITAIAATVHEALIFEHGCTIVAANRNADIEEIAERMEKAVGFEKARILLLQSAKTFAKRKCSEEDPYHQWRLPELLCQLAKGQLDPTLDRIEVELAKKAAWEASTRFDALDMDWTSALRGCDDLPEGDDFTRGLELLIKVYAPQVIIGTIGMLKKFLDALKPVSNRIVCDESHNIATIDVIHMLATWTHVASVTLIGDDSKHGSSSAGQIDRSLEKFGFDSVLERAASHPHVAKTLLDKRSTEQPLGHVSGSPLAPTLTRCGVEDEGESFTGEPNTRKRKAPEAEAFRSKRSRT